MCGLIGVAGDITREVQTRIFKDMLDVCQTRGRDSTGVIKVTDKLDYTWLKQVGPPVYLYDTKQYDKIIDAGASAALIGHCRARTAGEINVKNAHPFDYPEEGICGVHNGTLRSYYQMDTYHHSKVDSDVLYGHLAKNGVRDTFSEVEGAFACVWWNDKEKTLNFIRNDQRPLYFTWSEDCRMMFWASEIWMFSVIERKVKLWDGGKAGIKFIELPVNMHWSFKIDPNAKGDEKAIRMRPAVLIPPAQKKSYTTTTWQGNQHTHSGRTNSPWQKGENGTYSRTVVEKGPEASNKVGGEVTNPFVLAHEALDDPLPEELQGSTPADGTTSPLANVSFLTNSARTLTSGQPQTTTKDSKRPILSPTEKNSILYLPNNRGGQSERTAGFRRDGKRKGTDSLSRRQGSNLELLRGVSHRTIHGIRYITDNRTKEEYAEGSFITNTKGICCFCKHPTDLESVGEILSENSFICSPCLTEPKTFPFKNIAVN